MITIGVDIGQKRDPTAIAVTELDRRKVESRPTENQADPVVSRVIQLH